MQTAQATQQANEFASWFESFIVTYPVTTCIVLAWVVSWVVTVAFRPFLKRLLPDDLERHAIRLFDVMIAFLVVWDMWPGEYAHWWALGIGGLSPFAYFAFSELLCWQFPRMRRFLSLRELAPESRRTDAPEQPQGGKP